MSRQPADNQDYNIPPGQKILTVVQLDDGSNKAVHLHWGLIPSWSKSRDKSGRLINARAETLQEKPSFKQAFRHRRCLIPATGFYEWQKVDTGKAAGPKQAYHIHRSDNGLFAFAGLWEYWEHERETIYSCTIVTTTANEMIAPIHDRMPLIITGEHYQDWLNKKSTDVNINDFLAVDSYRDMEITRIGTRINNPMHNDPDCLKLS